MQRVLEITKAINASLKRKEKMGQGIVSELWTTNWADKGRLESVT